MAFRTKTDPRFQIRCGNKWSSEVCATTGTPEGSYDACLEDLKAEFAWVSAEAERLCDQGSITICHLAGFRFIRLLDFRAALEAERGGHVREEDLPMQGRFAHCYKYQECAMGWYTDPNPPVDCE